MNQVGFWFLLRRPLTSADLKAEVSVCNSVCDYAEYQERRELQTQGYCPSGGDGRNEESWGDSNVMRREDTERL